MQKIVATISKYKKINLDHVTNENKTGHNQKWLHIRDHPDRILIIEGSGSEKTNALLNLIKHQPDIYRYLIKHQQNIFIRKRPISNKLPFFLLQNVKK